ncbi:MAG: cell division topological specificity factor MinE [Anaerolineaceae bacterium]|nr:cell division topological specificity factor MinE [Anaerolineaceae bacterium]
MDWINRMFKRKTNSASSAKDRLQLVLIHDRTNLTERELTELKNDLLEVLSRYVEIDRNAVNISMEQNGREQRLLADIPVKSSGRPRR